VCCYMQIIGFLHACVYVKVHINAVISNILIAYKHITVLPDFHISLNQDKNNSVDLPG